ncbi:MAG: hypothetical protein MZV64_32040 [Ignavibacteriales bacterium]|nr:hypothetical protein [Ignavibacteriales bacterium]
MGIGFIKFSDSDVGLNLSLSLNYEIQNNNFNFSFLNSSELELFNHPNEYNKSYAVKYGRSLDFSMRGLILPFPFLLFLKKDFDYSLIGRIGVSYNKRY